MLSLRSDKLFVTAKVAPTSVAAIVFPTTGSASAWLVSEKLPLFVAGVFAAGEGVVDADVAEEVGEVEDVEEVEDVAGAICVCVEVICVPVVCDEVDCVDAACACAAPHTIAYAHTTARPISFCIMFFSLTVLGIWPN